MKPIELRIQNYDTQTGIGNVPLIMWKYDVGNHVQTAYKIEIFQNGACIHSTDKIISDEQNNISLKFEFKEQAEYEYRVCVWDENGVPYYSDYAKFISGVKSWRGSWIGNGSRKPFIAKKKFIVDKIEKSVLSICVPGQYEVRLNDKKISPFVYEGCQTDYHKHVHYNTYDISDFLIIGENELTIEVANGWYIGDDDNGKRYFYTMGKGYEAFGSCLALLAQIKIGDQYIVSDTSWQIGASKTVLANNNMRI